MGPVIVAALVTVTGPFASSPARDGSRAREARRYARAMMIHQDVPTVSAMPRPRLDDTRWTQVLTRAVEADGRFVYAVQSTGVFCRPTCPSRRPRRDRVRFFDLPLQAEHAGYRACLRCAPQGARPVNAAVRAVAQAASYLRAQATEPVALADLAAHVHLSPSHLQRAFTAHTGALAARVPRGLPGRTLPPRLARGARCHDRHLRGRLRIAEPRVGAQAHRQRPDPRRLPARRCRRDDSLRRGGVHARPAAGGGHREGRVRREARRRRGRPRGRADARVPGRAKCGRAVCPRPGWRR